jgi:hypothetical protein
MAADEFELDLGAAASREFVALRRPGLGFHATCKIEVLRRIVFMESWLRIVPLGRLYCLIHPKQGHRMDQVLTFQTGGNHNK